MNWLQIAGGKKMEPDKVQWHMQIICIKKPQGSKANVTRRQYLYSRGKLRVRGSGAFCRFCANKNSVCANNKVHRVAFVYSLSYRFGSHLTECCVPLGQIKASKPASH